MGDRNAKLGKEQKYKPTAGDHSKHELSNENGEKLTEFSIEQDLRIMSTYFKHKEIHKETWTTPDDRVTTQIDHIMIRW